MTTTIQQADLIESISAALQYISYYHPCLLYTSDAADE